MSPPVDVRIQIRGHVDLARVVVEVGRVCEELGARADQRSLLTTAASELSTNIDKYAGSGVLRIRSVTKGTTRGIEISASDDGPGIENVEAAMEDHFSTSGTLGLGLGGVRRIVDDFEIESELGKGTRVTGVKWL